LEFRRVLFRSKPTVLGWFFFVCSPQCWRGFGPRCEGRRRPGHPGFGPFSVLRCPSFSVSAKEDFATDPALARVSGVLFVRKTAFTQATRSRTGLLVDDGADVPDDGRSGPVDHLVAVLDAGLQMLGQGFVVLPDGRDRPV